MCVRARSGSNPGPLGSKPSAFKLTNCASCQSSITIHKSEVVMLDNAGKLKSEEIMHFLDLKGTRSHPKGTMQNGTSESTIK